MRTIHYARGLGDMTRPKCPAYWKERDALKAQRRNPEDARWTPVLSRVTCPGCRAVIEAEVGSWAAAPRAVAP